MKWSTLWTFCELEIALKLICIEADGVFFQVKQTSSLYLVYSAFCVYLNCGECIVATLYLFVYVK
jgi:hypothetical protein